STDGTYDAAVEAGAKVVRREEVLTDFEPLPGKGEVLWRSLAATTGDVLVFVDSDLRDFTTGFVQPLSGEYAARRPLLEQLPFPTGYGVEIGILVDALRLVGLEGLAQVDLSRRKHRNQEIGKLGRMSSEILQVVLDRLRSEGRLTLADPVGTELVQFERSDRDYMVHTVDMVPRERPPMDTVPEYRARYPERLTR
ncbi:MAG TPA: hypothetical protein VE547_16760, partial [Mycobacteriales bacterium]|nr:hypothetical protein [Mycobacteriales bacterium]